MSTSVGYFRGAPPDDAFGDALKRAYTDRNVAYNVVVHYHSADGAQNIELSDFGRNTVNGVTKTIASDIDAFSDDPGAQMRVRVNRSENGKNTLFHQDTFEVKDQNPAYDVNKIIRG